MKDMLTTLNQYKRNDMNARMCITICMDMIESYITKNSRKYHTCPSNALLQHFFTGRVSRLPTSLPQIKFYPKIGYVQIQEI